MAVTAVASVTVCSLPNRLSALAGVVLLTVLSLFIGLVGSIELSVFIVTSGLDGETLGLAASVNLVDLDAGVVGALVVFIVNCVCGGTSIDKKITQVVELGVECGAVNHGRAIDGCHFGKCRLSGIVVVKVAVDGGVIFEIWHSLVDIDNRVEYDCVGSSDDVECDGREIINESLEHDTLC